MARISINVGNTNIEDVELVLRPGVTVTGAIREDGEAPVPMTQVMVTLQPKKFSLVGGTSSANVNADGTFSIPNVSPNTYRVVASVRGAQPAFVKSVLACDQELPDSE